MTKGGIPQKRSRSKENLPVKPNKAPCIHHFMQSEVPFTFSFTFSKNVLPKGTISSFFVESSSLNFYWCCWKIFLVFPVMFFSNHMNKKPSKFFLD